MLPPRAARAAAFVGMTAHGDPFVGCERTGLLDYLLGDGGHAEVVQEGGGAQFQKGAAVVADSIAEGEGEGVDGDVDGVDVELGAGLQEASEGGEEGRLGGGGAQEGVDEGPGAADVVGGR